MIPDIELFSYPGFEFFDHLMQHRRLIQLFDRQIVYALGGSSHGHGNSHVTTGLGESSGSHGRGGSHGNAGGNGNGHGRWK